MAGENTAGSIALELVIRSKVEEQLDKIRQSVAKPAQELGKAMEETAAQPLNKLPEAVDNAVSQAMDKAGKTVEKSGGAVEKAVNKVSEQIQEELGSFEIATDPTERMKQQLENMTEHISIVRDKWQELQGALETSDDEGVGKIISQLNQTEGLLISLTERAEKLRSKIEAQVAEAADKGREKLAEMGKYEIPADPVVRLWTEIGHANTKLSILQKKWQELSAAQPTENVTAQLVKTEQQIISTRDKLDKLHAKLSELETAPAPEIVPKDAADRVTRSMDKSSAKIRASFDKTFKKLRSGASQALGTVSSRLSGIGKTARSAISPVEKLGNMLKRSFKRVFFAAGIYAAFRALKDGLLEALKANDEFAKSLNAVKANLSVAFTPIIQAIMPALTTMMNGLAAVTKQIAGFMAGLFGKTYSQALAATKKLKGVTDAAKKASMATAGIDEMNILGSDDSGSDSEGTDYSALDGSEPELPDWAERLKESIRAGDWGGVGSILAERVNSAFSAINWEKVQSKVNSGVQKVCDLINGFTDKLDWPLIGKSLGEGINTLTGAVNTFADGVKWTRIGSGIAKGLNKAIATVKWSQLGKALAARLRILTDILYGFVANFDWKALGKGFGQGINGAFESIDFGKAGTTLSEGIKGILDAARAFLDTVDFGSIGGKIADFVNNIDIAGILSRLAGTLSTIVTSSLALALGLLQGIDWSQLGTQIWDSVTGMLAAVDWGGIVSGTFELIGTVLAGSVSLIVSLLKKAWGAVTQAWNSVKAYFGKKIEECGGNVVAGLFDGILTALSNVGRWIKDHIFKPFIEGFKKAFGIASPSKEMATMGGYIIDGLYGAVSDGITRIREIFQKMLSVIKSTFDGIREWFSEKFSGAWDAVKNAFSAVGSFFSETFSNAWEGLKSAFSLEKVGEYFGRVWTAITGCFGKVTSWFRDTFSSAWQAVKDVFSRGGAIFEGITTAIADTFKEVVNSLIDGINEVISVPFNTINDALWSIRNWELWTPWGDFYPFEWLPEVSIPQIPHLAKGGLATAPTLAMVGDNRNAMQDPEVIAPLSKLEGMLGSSDAQMVELLRTIVELLRNGLSAELIGSLFGDSDLRRVVLRIIAADNASKGGIV
ncbi:MAG: hypothetical protein IJ170_11790 [Ruminococcus sp.]|nr:hypothetical protein [Ruminococcus sp.]